MENKLEKLKKKIYHPEGGKELEERLKRPEKPAEEKEKAKAKWKPLPERKEKFQIPTWGLLAVVIFLGLALLGFAYWQWAKFQPQKVSLKIETLKEVPAAEVLNLNIIIKNKNRQPLKNTQLTLNYPQLTYSEQKKSFTSQEVLDIGTIEKGATKIITKKIRLLAPVYANLEIKAMLEFKGGKKTITKSASFATQIISSPLKISIQKPRRLVQGQSTIYKIFYKNTSDFDFPSSRLRLFLPQEFRVDLAQPQPIQGTTWSLGPLKGGKQGKIIVKGVLLKKLNRARFKAFIESKLQQQYTPFAQTTILQEVSPPALAVSQSINKIQVKWSSIRQGPPQSKKELQKALKYRKKMSLEPIKTVKAAGLGQVYKVMLEIENTTETVFRDIIVTADVGGELFDPSWVIAERLGQVGPRNRHIAWTKEKMAPKEKDQFGFYVGLKENLPLSIYKDKNKLLSHAKIDARVVPQGWKGIKIASESWSELKLETKPTLLAKISPPHAPLAPSGPVPPVIKKQTTYTLQWEIKNTYNNIKEVTIEASLPENVEWTGEYLPKEANVNYNSLKNKLTLHIQKVPYGTGYISSPARLFFQVTVTPQPAHYGKQILLLGPSQFTGQDTFTGKNINIKAKAIKTATKVAR